MVKNRPNIDYLLAGAQLQDSLLQNYRQIHLIVQSIFIAIGVGLCITILSFDKFVQSALATLILIVFAGISLYLLYKLRKITIARGEDVNYWHRKIIIAEQSFPPDQRYFTEFKIYQKLHRADSNYLTDQFLTNKEINDAQVNLLVEKGLGHTRKILDQWLFTGIFIIWALLLVMSTGYIFCRHFGLL
jgi:hypothetical protein